MRRLLPTVVLLEAKSVLSMKVLNFIAFFGFSEVLSFLKKLGLGDLLRPKGALGEGNYKELLFLGLPLPSSGIIELFFEFKLILGVNGLLLCWLLTFALLFTMRLIGLLIIFCKLSSFPSPRIVRLNLKRGLEIFTKLSQSPLEVLEPFLMKLRLAWMNLWTGEIFFFLSLSVAFSNISSEQMVTSLQPVFSKSKTTSVYSKEPSLRNLQV